MLFPIASSRSARDPPPARPTGAQRSFLRASNVPAFSEGHYETVLGLFQYVVAVQVKHLFEYLLIEAIDECRQVLRSPGEVAGRPHIPLLLELPEGTTLGVLVGRLLEAVGASRHDLPDCSNPCFTNPYAWMVSSEVLYHLHYQLLVVGGP